MGDRTYNDVDIAIYDEDWSEDATLVALLLLTKCPNQYGIFKMPWGFLKKVMPTKLSCDQIRAGVSELVKDGMIALYGEEQKYVWLKKKWARNPMHEIPNNQKGAIKWVLEHYPVVANDFISLYAGGEMPVDCKPGSQADEQDQIQDDDPADETSGALEKEETPLKQDYIDLIAELLPVEAAIPASLKKQYDALEKLIRIDKGKIDVKQEYTDDTWQVEVFAVLRWMRFDDDANTPNGSWKGWSAVFNSIVPLRKNNCEKYKNARAQYQKCQVQKTKPRQVQQPKYER